MLLNTVSDRRGRIRQIPISGIGWEEFTDAVIEAVNAQDRPMRFYCCGDVRRKQKASMLDESAASDSRRRRIRARCLRTADFSAAAHFSQTNEFLKAHGVAPIDWQIENR